MAELEIDNNIAGPDGKILSIVGGEFFPIVSISSNKDCRDPKKRKVKAKCTLCKQTICGQLNATTNFKVERLFSAGGLIQVPRKNKLSDATFEKLLLIKANKFDGESHDSLYNS